MRMPLTDIPTNVAETSFSAYSFAETGTSQTEKKRKAPVQWQECYGDLTGGNKSAREKVTCMICNFNLNSLTLLERSAHVNRCIDRKGNKVKSVKSMRSPRPRNDNDENDIASIFSPNSSSTMIAGSSESNRNIKSKGNTKKKTATKFNEENRATRCAEIDSTSDNIDDFKPLICEKGTYYSHKIESGEYSSEVPEGRKIIGTSFPATIQGSTSFDQIKRQGQTEFNANTQTNISMNIAMNAGMTNMNMTPEEMELFYLRLQLGEYSAREAELRVKKAVTMKNIKKVMKKVAKKSENKKKMISTVIKKDDIGEGAEDIDDQEEKIIEDSDELKLNKRIAFDAAMSILFPENYYLDSHDDLGDCIASTRTDHVIDAQNTELETNDSKLNNINDQATQSTNIKAIKKFENCVHERKNIFFSPFSRLVSLVRESPLWVLSTQINEEDIVRFGGKLFVGNNIFGEPSLENLGILDFEGDSKIFEISDTLDMETGMEIRIGTGIEIGTETRIVTGTEGGTGTGMETGVETGIETGMMTGVETEMETKMETGIGTAMETSVRSNDSEYIDPCLLRIIPCTNLIKSSATTVLDPNGTVDDDTGDDSISCTTSFMQTYERLLSSNDCHSQIENRFKGETKDIGLNVSAAASAIMNSNLLFEMTTSDQDKPPIPKRDFYTLYDVEVDLFTLSILNAKHLLGFCGTLDPDTPVSSISSKHLLLYLLQRSELWNTGSRSNSSGSGSISSLPLECSGLIEMVKRETDGGEVKGASEQRNEDLEGDDVLILREVRAKKMKEKGKHEEEKVKEEEKGKETEEKEKGIGVGKGKGKVQWMEEKVEQNSVELTDKDYFDRSVEKDPMDTSPQELGCPIESSGICTSNSGKGAVVINGRGKERGDSGNRDGTGMGTGMGRGYSLSLSLAIPLSPYLNDESSSNADDYTNHEYCDQNNDQNNDENFINLHIFAEKNSNANNEIDKGSSSDKNNANNDIIDSSSANNSIMSTYGCLEGGSSTYKFLDLTSQNSEGSVGVSARKISSTSHVSNSKDVKDETYLRCSGKENRNENENENENEMESSRCHKVSTRPSKCMKNIVRKIITIDRDIPPSPSPNSPFLSSPLEDNDNTTFAETFYITGSEHDMNLNTNLSESNTQHYENCIIRYRGERNTGNIDPKNNKRNRDENENSIDDHDHNDDDDDDNDYGDKCSDEINLDRNSVSLKFGAVCPKDRSEKRGCKESSLSLQSCSPYSRSWEPSPSPSISHTPNLCPPPLEEDNNKGGRGGEDGEEDDDEEEEEETEREIEIRAAIYAKNLQIFESLKIEIDRNCLAKQLSEAYSTRPLPASSQSMYPSTYPSFLRVDHTPPTSSSPLSPTSTANPVSILSEFVDKNIQNSEGVMIMKSNMKPVMEMKAQNQKVRNRLKTLHAEAEEEEEEDPVVVVEGKEKGGGGRAVVVVQNEVEEEEEFYNGGLKWKYERKKKETHLEEGSFPLGTKKEGGKVNTNNSMVEQSCSGQDFKEHSFKLTKVYKKYQYGAQDERAADRIVGEVMKGKGKAKRTSFHSTTSSVLPSSSSSSSSSSSFSSSSSSSFPPSSSSSSSSSPTAAPHIPIPSFSSSFSSSSVSSSSNSSSSSSSNSSIPLDIFKLKEEPNFDKYSLSELQKLCAMYGLKKDTKIRLTTILLAMWRKTQAQLVLSHLSSNNNNYNNDDDDNNNNNDNNNDNNNNNNNNNDNNDSKGNGLHTKRRGSKDSQKQEQKQHENENENENEKETEKEKVIRKEKGKGNNRMATDKSRVMGASVDIDTNRERRVADKIIFRSENECNQEIKNKNENDSRNENVNEIEIENLVCSDSRPYERITKQSVLSFLKSQFDLHMMIICFEPLDLDSVHKRFLSQGFKITKPELLGILDSEFFFVSCGMDAKVKQRENKKLNPKQNRNKSRK